VPLDRSAILDRFTRTRARTRALLDLITKGPGQPGIDEGLEAAVARDYATAADRLRQDAIAAADLERDDHPMLRNAQALWTMLEHEDMHQETLACMWHQLPHEWKTKPAHYVTAPPRLAQPAVSTEHAQIPRGTASMGTADCEGGFAWDNERPAHLVTVEPFAIGVHPVTNAGFMEFVEAGGYRDARWWRPEDFARVTAGDIRHPPFWHQHDGRWRWRGMFESVPLPEAWPVYVTWAEARAYAHWRGMRLPTESEFHRAAYGTPEQRERRYPWGDALGRRPPENFDFLRWDPDPVDAHPQAASAFGVQGLVGNGWEWTSTVFGPFDGDHYVMKGASPVTARALVRPGFRNWGRPRDPYVYAKFRCAHSR